MISVTSQDMEVRVEFEYEDEILYTFTCTKVDGKYFCTTEGNPQNTHHKSFFVENKSSLYGDYDGEGNDYSFRCPHCECPETFTFEQPEKDDDPWEIWCTQCAATFIEYNEDEIYDDDE